MSWARGKVVRFRYVRDARAFWTLPVIVAADEPDELALWIAPNVPIRRPDPRVIPIRELAAGRWEPVDVAWEGPGVLMLRRPDTHHALWHFWDEDSSFRGWYVNLEDWWRTAEGVDAYDHQLDVWVTPDGSWAWKDEDHLQESVEEGIFSAHEAEAIRAYGERVLAEWPFPTGWEDWRPDPEWPLPRLEKGSDVA